MDFKEWVNEINTAAAVLSVEQLPGDACGEIRILEANEKYVDTMCGYQPGMIYSDLVPKDVKFEANCYRSAIKGQRLHAYVETRELGGWTDQMMLPLKSNTPGIGYCLFAFEFTKSAEPNRQANVSIDVANDILKTCIKLRGANDFISTLDDVIHDIRVLCDADSCSILSVDWERESVKLLSVDFKSNHTTSDLSDRELSEKTFYQVVKTWPKTIGSSDCIIVQDKNDMEYLSRRNPVWTLSLMSANVHSLVLFPLISSNNTVGYIWATNFDTEKTVRIKETLSLTSYFIASEIANHHLMAELERISITDSLTGAKNRNAMNYFISRFALGKVCDNFGVIYADLNGLKRANDSGGHVEGDKLLKRAAALLQKVFPNDSVFRAGGG